jgi:predicted ATPase
VVEELGRRGFRVLPEAARALIEAGLRGGLRLEAVKADAGALEHRIFQAKLSAEASLPEGELVFLDRALPDSIAYFTLEGLDPGEPRAQSLRVRYRRVFLFERLPFLPDRVRGEDPATAARIERLIAQAYLDLGYRLHRVPVLPVASRADHVLSRLAPAIP